jgi:hypothetical protein
VLALLGIGAFIREHEHPVGRHVTSASVVVYGRPHCRINRFSGGSPLPERRDAYKLSGTRQREASW